jgi:hypothetical protein
MPQKKWPAVINRGTFPINRSTKERRWEFVYAAQMHIQPSDTKVYRAAFADARLGLNPSPAYGMPLIVKKLVFYGWKMKLFGNRLTYIFIRITREKALWDYWIEEILFRIKDEFFQKVHKAILEVWLEYRLELRIISKVFSIKLCCCHFSFASLGGTIPLIWNEPAVFYSLSVNPVFSCS